MADDRTDDALDALADLFLTGTGGMVPLEPSSPPRPAARIAPAGPHALSQAQPDARAMRLTPKMTGAGSPSQTGHALSSHGPVVTASRPAVQAIHPLPQGQAQDMTRIIRDALSRPGDARHPKPQSDRQRRRTEPPKHDCLRVEGVFMGSLPGLAGPWLTQYAHYVSQRRGDVLLVHVDDEHVELEIISSLRSTHGPATRSSEDQDTAPAPPPLRLIHPKPPERLADSLSEDPQADGEDEVAGPLAQMLQQVIENRTSPIGAILIHLPNPVTAVQMRQALSLPCWTLVCGGFDAAVVGGYRLLKQLSEAATATEQSVPEVGLMVMGAADDRCQEAARKLNDAGASFLETPVALIGCQRQMQPVNSRFVGRFIETDEDAAAGHAPGILWQELMSVLVKVIAPPQASGDMEAAMTTEEADPPMEMEADETSAFEDEPPAAPGWDDEPSAAWAVAARPASAVRPPRVPAPGMRPQVHTTAHATPAPPRSPRSRTPAADPATRSSAAEMDRARSACATRVDAPPCADSVDLSQFLEQAGCVLMQARCPHHPQTQLALDPTGRLHLLRQHLPDEAATTPGLRLAMLRSAVIDLIETRRWAKEHRSLLKLSQPNAPMDEQQRPVLHLFTADAKTGTGLIRALGRFVTVHLLQHIHVQDRQTWFSTPLN